MAAFDVESIAKEFGFDDISFSEISAGHINATYRIDTEKGSFLLQRVNTAIFTEPGKMMENISLVLEKIPSLFLVRTNDGRLYHEDESGFYRVYNFIRNSISYDKVTSPEMAAKMGEALRSFHGMLSEIDGSRLYETIPHFHDMFSRFEQFDEAVRNDRVGRAGKVSEEIGFMNRNRERAERISSLYASGALPVHVTHNDTKLSNVLFDKTTGRYITFIDLDTVMPGTVLFDTGDMIRTGCSTAEEDEKDLDKVHFSVDYFKAMENAYVSGNENLTETEKSLFAESGRTITFIMALRFLTDYLNGDTYYRVDYSEHNLVRTRNQMKLIEEMDKLIF